MYLPTLKLKQGELQALKEFENSKYTSDKVADILPNIIINDADQDTLTKIRKKYSGHVLLDTRFLDPDDIVELSNLIQNNEKFDILFPLDAILDEEFIKLIPNQIIKYVRIANFKNNFNFFLDGLKSQLHKLPKNIILDLGFIETDLLTAETAALIQSLSGKSIFLVSGSMRPLIPTRADENYEQPVYEFLMYKKAVNFIETNSLNVKLQFGDYATVYPTMQEETSEGFRGIPIVQVRYTRNPESYWLVRNGQRKGNYDFRSVASEIVTSPDFIVSSWCDEFLNDLHNDRNHRIGNTATWAALNINRHMSVMA